MWYLISSLFLSLIGGGHHLSTDSCALDVAMAQNQSQVLCFTADLAKSGEEFTGYKITKKDDKVYISLYSNLFNVFSSKFCGNFNYDLPDNVNEIYLCGKNEGDIKLIWRRS